MAGAGIEGPVTKTKEVGNVTTSMEGESEGTYIGVVDTWPRIQCVIYEVYMIFNSIYIYIDNICIYIYITRNTKLWVPNLTLSNNVDFTEISLNSITHFSLGKENLHLEAEIIVI